MMKYGWIVVLIVWWMVFSLPAEAFDLEDGIHGMKWGEPASKFSNLSKVRASDSVAYFVNSNTLYQVANQPVPAVIYGFYRGQFFAVYIKLGSPNQFQQTMRHYRKKYGEPKLSVSKTANQTVYRWKVGEVKIKLKHNASKANFKLAIYSSELSRHLTEERLEKFPEEIPDQIDPTIRETPIPLLQIEE